MTTPRIPMVEILTNEEPPVQWLIPDFIPTGSLIALAGMPGTGKSFFAYGLGLALATGTDYLGWTMEPQRVLYFDQENSRSDLVQYARWAWVGLGCPSLDLVQENFCLLSFYLGGVDWAARMAEAIQEHVPALIIIDTTTPACNVDDENANAEASRIIGQIRRLQRLVPVTPAVLALKHAKVRGGDSGGYTLRGAKAWEGNVDAVIFQIRNEGRARADGLRITRLEPAKTRAFGLRETVVIDPQWIENRAGLWLRRGSKDLLSPHDQ